MVYDVGCCVLITTRHNIEHQANPWDICTVACSLQDTVLDLLNCQGPDHQLYLINNDSVETNTFN